jgi:hypothetical protein
LSISGEAEPLVTTVNTDFYGTVGQLAGILVG